MGADDGAAHRVALPQLQPDPLAERGEHLREHHLLVPDRAVAVPLDAGLALRHHRCQFNPTRLMSALGLASLTALYILAQPTTINHVKNTTLVGLDKKMSLESDLQSSEGDLDKGADEVPLLSSEHVL